MQGIFAAFRGRNPDKDDFAFPYSPKESGKSILGDSEAHSTALKTLSQQGREGSPLANPPLFRGHAVPTPGRGFPNRPGPPSRPRPAALDPSSPLFFALRQGKSDVLQICLPALRLSATLEQRLEQGLRPSHPGAGSGFAVMQSFYRAFALLLRSFRRKWLCVPVASSRRLRNTNGA